MSLTSISSSTQLLDETVGAAKAASGAVGAALRPIGSSNIWARSGGSGGGAASCAVSVVVGGAARVDGSACLAVFPGSGPESSEEKERWQEYAEEVALAEEELAFLAFPCHQSANPAHRTPAGVPAGSATAITGPRGAGEIKFPGQLLDEAVGAAEPASGMAGVAPGPVGSSNIWARSGGSGGGAACSAGSAANGAARVALFLGAGLESSERSEEPWEEEVAFADENPARLAFSSCPTRRSANTAQRKPVGVLAGTAALAPVFDEIERPGQLFDEAVGAADRVGGTASAAPKRIGASDIWARSAGSGDGAVSGKESSAEVGAVGGMVDTADGTARLMGGAGVAGSGGWTRRLAKTAGSMTGAAVVVLAGGEHGADTRAQD